jgi:maltose alpha-D-glucosyltransferase/alpha-amylase
MPRLFYALREGSARQIIDILADTPEIPAGAQWGTFLRNHDELTLEMVSGEDRSAMLGWYAPDSRMRANVGIRRRLAPLLDNSRSEIELIHALLLSLPGSPFLYYGDEIAMGDNIWLEDRDAVRTPMQWTPDRNAGFSEITDPGKLYLPVIQSLVYHYSTTNVEAHMAHSGSLLHFVRWMLAVRKEHEAFGMGAYRHLPADSERVLAFTRTYDGLEYGEDAEFHAETLLCVFNLSPQPVTATLEVTGMDRRTVRDLFGGHEFPAIGEDGTLTLTLGGHGFYWLKVRPLDAHGEPMTTTTALPVISAD